MLIAGRWHVCEHSVLRPVISGEVGSNDGTWRQAEFLVDTGADRTVFNAQLLAALGLPCVESPLGLGGVGGRAATVFVETRIRLFHEGGTVLFRSRFAAFTDPVALDMSVLGRDLMNLFAVVVDRPRDTVCMLGPNHHYTIAAA